jgi:hypothetical protein
MHDDAVRQLNHQAFRALVIRGRDRTGFSTIRLRCSLGGVIELFPQFLFGVRFNLYVSHEYVSSVL